MRIETSRRRGFPTRPRRATVHRPGLRDGRERSVDVSRTATLAQLNKLLASELAGANRYLHHSFMVFGFSRKPIVGYLRQQSTESLAHAALLGEKIVALGGHPTVSIEARWEPEK